MSQTNMLQYDIIVNTTMPYLLVSNLSTVSALKSSLPFARLGIWADEESDEEGNGQSNKRGRGSRKAAKDYKAPLNFVSGGIKVGDLSISISLSLPLSLSQKYLFYF